MAMVLCLSMVLSTVGTVAFAETTEADVWDGTVDTSWYDAANPQTEYILTTAEQFAGLAYLVNAAQTYSPAIGNNTTADFGYYCGENKKTPKIAAPAADAACVDFDGITIKLAADLDMRAVYANGDPVLLPGNEYLTMMPIGYSIYTPFKGTFDGQGHTIKNVFQGMWDALGHPSDSYDQDIALGIFGNVENATIKNLVVDNISFNAESVLGGVVGQVKGKSVFDTIIVKNSVISSSGGWRAGGLIGDAEGDLTVKNIIIDETNTVAQTGGNYDTAVGGIVAKYSDGGSIAFENCDVACKLDVYNDVVANWGYKTHVYRNCGLIIGAIGEDNEVTIDGKLYPNFVAKGLTFNNVKATFGDWANYTYCWSDEISKGCQRIEPGVGYEGINVSNLNDYSVERIIFDALFGAENAGDLSNVRQRVDIEVAESLGVTGIEAEEYQLLSGEGTETDPYLINNIEDLRNFRDDVNIGNTYEGKYVELTADIDLTGEVWAPIGTSVYSKEPTDDDIKMFAGNFDGGNHTIKGLTSEGYVPDSAETEDNEYSFGLFGCVYGSNISNIKLEDVDVDGTTRENSDGNNVDGSGVAALVGYYMPVDGKTSIIENCHVLSGKVKASNNMGGLIGFIDSNSRMPEVDITIKDCSNAADVTTEAREAGGIVGLIRSSRTSIEYISMRGNILFENCTNSGDITSLGSGAPSAGGILGRDGNEDSWQKLNMVFDGCKNTGTITVTANGETHAAGIAAGFYSNGAWLIVDNCKNTGDVVVKNPGNKVYAGGLISYGGVVELLNSTSSKAVKLGTENGNTYIGGVASILFIDEIYGYADTVNGCTYYLNGGDAPNERKYLTDDSGNYNFFPVETASKDGFEFGYWYDNAELNGKMYDANTNIRNENAKVFYAKWIGPVAKIGDVEYNSLEEAFAEAQEGDTIKLLTNAAPALTSQRAITKASVIDLNGNKITLTEDDLYFGTTTFKNGEIVVEPSVKPSTAVFWMFKDQTLTFDNVKLTATGVTGTYLIGLDGNNSDLNLLNGSEIIVDNDKALDLDIICVNASTGNDILVDNSKVSVKNLDGRVFFRGNYTISGNSDIDMEGITKAGIRIEAGQTLNITDTATVDISGELRDGGIHITALPATYSKADTAVVNATVNAPASDAKIGDTEFATLKDAVDAAKNGDAIKLLHDITVEGETYTIPDGKAVILDMNGKTITAVDNKASNVNYELFYNYGDLTVTGNGTIDLTSTSNDTAWAKSSSIFHNRGAVLVIENGTFTHKGGTAMAYVVDNSGNSYGDATTTVNDGTLKSSYITIRNRMDTYAANGGGNGVAALDINGGYFEGKYAIWGQVSSTGVKGNIDISKGIFIAAEGKNAILVDSDATGEIVTAISGGTFSSDVSGYVATGYKTSKTADGLYVVYPDFVVEAIASVNGDADVDTAVAGDKITVQVKVTKGGNYTNADWTLKYDPRYVTYDGTDDKNYKISGKVYNGTPNDGYDELNADYVLGTYTFTVNELTTEATAAFEIVDAHVHNYAMSVEFDGVEASKQNDYVAIKFKTADREIVTKKVTYNGMEQRGNGVKDAPANATITYSKTNNFTDGTQLPPAFVDAGTHTYYAQIKLDGYATKVVEGTLVIDAKDVEPSVEWMVAPESDKVEFIPVIKGVVDESYKNKGGKVTVTGQKADGTAFTYEFDDMSKFAYDGHGKAVYTGAATELSGIKGNELLEVTVKYIAGTTDNYASGEKTASVYVNKSTIDDTMEDKLATYIKGNGEVVYDGQTHYVTVDNTALATLKWTATFANHTGVTNYGDVNVVDVTFTDTTGKYNDYTATVMIKIVRRDVTIYVNNATKKNGQADSEAIGWGYTATTANGGSGKAIIGDDLGEIEIVRANGQTEEVEGTYAITAIYTPNDNYIVRVENNTLTISNAVFVVEVVDNAHNGNELKYQDVKGDYTTGSVANGNIAKKMILVHTDANYAFFTYKGEKMYDVTEAGYDYVDHNYAEGKHENKGKYQHVYAIVVDAEYGDVTSETIEGKYASHVAYAGKDATAAYAPVKVTYDADINDKSELHTNDYSTVKGVYGGIYSNNSYQISILKADYNKDKIVNTADAIAVKNVVIGE